jgi:Carboxypeptidase regulatory-like domain
MNRTAAKAIFTTGIALALVTNSGVLHAQDATATLTGTVTDAAGKVVANAKVSCKNLTTGQSTEIETNTAGVYSAPNLPPADYEVSVAAEGFEAKIIKVTLAAGASQSGDASLTVQQARPAATPSSSQSPSQSPSTPASGENLPNAPSSTKTEPSLQDLGFSTAETQGNLKQQALLDKRTHMLKIHQRMGLITTIPLIATVILGPGAGGKSEGTTTRDLHVALGALTGDLYGITAYYAIRAPRIPGTKKRGPIKFHEAMAWIHGPGMILTPILGAMAFDQKNNGEKVHGIAQAHGPVAIVTAGAFGAALLSVSVKF